MAAATPAHDALWVYRCPKCRATCRHESISKYILCFECYREFGRSYTYRRSYLSWGQREWILVVHFSVLAEVADMSPEDLEILFLSLKNA